MQSHIFVISSILQLIGGSSYSLNRCISVSSSIQSPTRILGGVNSKNTLEPFQCKLLANPEIFKCGCALIRSNWVLTSKNCVVGESASGLIVEVGSKLEVQMIQTIRRLSDDDLPKFANDIALLQLNTEVPVNDDIKTIALPTAAGPKLLVEGGEYEFIGWGRLNESKIWPQHLQVLKVKAINKQKCRIAYDNKQVEDSHFCTLPRRGEGACYGDSGSPLITNATGIPTVVGIASFAIPCGRGYPDAFTNVSSLLEWIEMQMQFLKI